MTIPAQCVELTERIIGAAIEVHRELGPGLLESNYEDCLEFELACAGHSVDRQQRIPVVYKGIALGSYYRPDVVVDGTVIVEVKAVEKLLGVHQAQIMTYLKVTGLRVGLILNFHTQFLRDGIKRVSL
ncbi:MAG: GxxExxY protein [Gemmatimonadales bacterium]